MKRVLGSIHPRLAREETLAMFFFSRLIVSQTAIKEHLTLMPLINDC